MNCFDLQNRVSDYLDGTLMGSAKADADEHLDGCRECSERYGHYRQILSSIAAQPRASLPIPIRKSPLAGVLPLPGKGAGILSRARWERIPWYLRTTLEGAGIVLMVLLGISAGPRLRAIYERSVEANLEDFAQSFRDWRDPMESPKPLPALALAKAAPAGAGPAQDEDFSSGDSDTDTGDDTAGDDSDTSGDVTDGEIHVHNSEIWRFIIRTDSPQEIRTKIIKLLTDLKVPASTPGLGGIEAPGGIQFDLLLSQTLVPSLKRQLQALTPKSPADLAQSPALAGFTWYMSRSKHKIPDRETRVVIWLSQM